jgi:hypothetical protein
MGEGFVKLFSSILDSSVWDLDTDTRIVWITLLAMADAQGRVHASMPGIANRARVTREVIEKAMKIFQEPDEYSRSENNDGRRIVRDGRDWVILNYAEHRARASALKEKERKRQWWRDNRSKEAQTSEELANTSDTRHKQKQIQKTEADTETEEEPLKSKLARDVLTEMRKRWEYNEDRTTAATLAAHFGDRTDRLVAYITDAAAAWTPTRSVYTGNGLHGYLYAFVTNGIERAARAASSPQGKGATPESQRKPLSERLGGLSAKISNDHPIGAAHFADTWNEAVEDGYAIPNIIRDFTREMVSLGVIELTRANKIDSWHNWDTAKTPGELRNNKGKGK